MIFGICGEMSELTTFKSACPLNCWDSCGFVVEVEDGKILKIDGDKEHPITKGKFAVEAVCWKQEQTLMNGFFIL